MRKLESLDFPGNVRELENVIERAVALTSGPTIGAADLPDPKSSAKIVSPTPTELPPDGVDLDSMLGDFERAWVMRALEQTGGVRKKAAALLGVSFRSLRYRLQKLGIEKADDKDDKDDKDEADDRDEAKP
jgi:two-component system, NtrC family, response regulator PilR